MISRKYLILISIVGFVIALDQASKLFVHTQFALSESFNVIPDFFDFTYIRNKGAAFGILRNSHESFRKIFFLTMPPVAIGIILMMLKSVPDNDKLQITALSLVFGGAIGNYIDRIRFDYVIDFLDFHIGSYVWPAFNVADISIVVGVALLFLAAFNQTEEGEAPA